MGQRNIIETMIDPQTVFLGTHSGNNATVVSAAFDNTFESQQCVVVNYNAWNVADTVAGGFVEVSLQHSDDTIVGSFIDVPNNQLSVNGLSGGLNGASTVSGGSATGVIANIPLNAPAGVAKASYLGNKRYVRVKRTSQTNIAAGFNMNIIMLDVPNAQPKGYNHKQ